MVFLLLLALVFLLLLALIALFFIIKTNGNTTDVMRHGPCSQFQKRTSSVQKGQSPKQGDENPVVQVTRMVCNLIGTLFVFWLKFLFAIFLLGIIFLVVCLFRRYLL
jgi:hypothetical protein